MKETLKAREAKEQKHTTRPFTACGKVVGGGILQSAGSECHGGLRVFSAMYNGQMERFARECECMTEWKSGRVKAPDQAVLSAG